MRVWRVASFAAAICASGLGLLFGYRLLWREGSGNVSSVADLGTVRDFLLAEVLVVLFVVAAVTFPYYWIRAMQLWWIAVRRQTSIQRRELTRLGIGFAGSCMCILLVFMLVHSFTTLPLW
jgi:hypothetical protein